MSTAGGRRRALAVVTLIIVIGAAALSACAVSGCRGEGPDWLSWPWSRKPSGELDPNAAIDPGRQYRLTVWDYSLPFTSPSGEPFSQAAADAIARFEDRYPNVSVDLVSLDIHEAPLKLAEALAAGYPPDVYCSPYGLPAYGSSFQIPLGLYLDDETWARYDPVAWQAVKIDGTVWSFPRWLTIWPWLGNRDLLESAGLDVDRVSAEGWSREEFSAFTAQLGQSTQQWARSAALAATSPAQVIRDLAFSECIQSLEEPQAEGESAPSATGSQTPATAEDFWLGSRPAQVVHWLDELISAGAALPDGSGTNPGVLDSFVHGRTSLLVPPSPWATTFLLELVDREQPSEYDLPDRERPPMVLLPPPHGEGEPSAVWVSAATVSVFRQARYKGDDHTRLAAELALELTRGTWPWLRDQVLCLPSLKGDLGSYELRAQRFGDYSRFALGCLDDLRSLPQDRLGEALTMINYGPAAPQPGENLGSGATSRQGEIPSTGRVAGEGSLVQEGYLGPFLVEAVAPEAARFWDGDASAGELVNGWTQFLLEGE